MIYSFIFFYLTGAVIYFCHTTLIFIKNTKSLSSYFHLSESESYDLLGTHLERILFQTIMMIVFPSSFTLYYIVNTHFNYNIFVYSGLFTIFWLSFTGLLIKSIYFILTHKIKTLNILPQEYFQNKEVFWVMCPLLYGILFSLYDSTIFFTILAVVLGKYIWMDTFTSFSSLKAGIIIFFKKFKLDIKLFLYQVIVMSFILLQWYPVKDKPLYEIDLLTTAIIFTFCLMPIIDFLIYNQMKSYCTLIISSRK